MPDLLNLLMNSVHGEDTPEKCLERSGRRILSGLRSPSSQAASSGTLPRQASGDSKGESVMEDEQVATAIATPPPVHVPSFGTTTVAGWSRVMEDAIATHTSLCSPAINGYNPVHFFGVYDGHGGAQVAALCRERMHVLLVEELKNGDHTVNRQSAAGGSSSSSGQRLPASTEEGWKETWKAVLKSSFMKMDQEALNTCVCGSIGMDCDCPCKMLVIGGSTAVVAVLTDDYIIVANCGDSRAVLCRGGKAVTISVDQKPNRPDELDRIFAAGGHVAYDRVEGILAMSRSIGDRYLKPVVISEPEVHFMKREPGDECLILASDGLWDVVSNDLACNVASDSLLGENPTNFVNPTPGRPLLSSRSVLAASLLSRLALARGSRDNISVIVVDLMGG